MRVLLLLGGVVLVAGAAQQAILPDKPNAVEFSAAPAQFVRFVVYATSDGTAACIDELEVYAPNGTGNLARLAGAKASASSCIGGYSIHKVEHLNDGEYGNGRSWVAAGTDSEWAQIELPQQTDVAKVVFSRDRNGLFRDRVPVKFDVCVSLDGANWKTVKSVSAGVAGEIAMGVIPSVASPPEPRKFDLKSDPVRSAFLGEEHAWLKTFGRADLCPTLVPYNGRVTEYPRHVGDDVLPLPELAREPRMNKPGWLDGASRGVVRVADPLNWEQGPLAEIELWAATYGEDVYLCLAMDRLLSKHLAVISSGDGGGAGVVVLEGERLKFNTYEKRNGMIRVADSVELDQFVAGDRELLAFRLPLALFPGFEKAGLRVGLGMGGKHTPANGRGILLHKANLTVREVVGKEDGFAVALWASNDVTISTNAAEHESVGLRAGEERVVQIKPEHGPVGPQFNLQIKDERGTEYALHLFKYEPVDRVLDLMDEMVARLEASGVDVEEAKARVAELREECRRGRRGGDTGTTKKVKAVRDLFYGARMAKRELMLRDPALGGIEKILFVKRHAFRPSHNYSDYFDAPFRPGGGIFVLEIPRDGDGLQPDRASLTSLFESGGGIARNPVADFDVQRVYFGYRDSDPGYYHMMSMAPDGTDLRQITDGPFHDFWPTPLPNGELAFISTRCTCRVFCWRPQSSVLYRMKPDGSEIRQLSLANLTEWAPSVMNDGRIIWTRWEYVDKGADFGHTLWSIRPDGTYPELIFGNDIIQPNGYANGRQVPGSKEIACTLISHFGDLNGPIALLDIDQGRFDPNAIKSLTPEVPWPGAPPLEECFREAYPVSRDYILCSHAARKQFGLYLIDRYGNRELLYIEPETISPEGLDTMCPTLFRQTPRPPVLSELKVAPDEPGEFELADVYAGLGSTVPRGSVKYLRVVEEVQHRLDLQPDGEYRKDHEVFFDFYASPVDKVNGPNGWPTYVAKASLGLVPVEENGSARFTAPAGKTVYFQALDKDYNEVQRMRSVVHLQPGEKRGCIGCHEDRQATALPSVPLTARTLLRDIETPSWGAEPFSFERVVQPVLDAKCVACHNEKHPAGLDFRGVHDADKVPASYRTLITKGLVHYADCGWNSGGCEKFEPMTFGSLKSRLWEVLNKGHHDVRLTADETLRIKTWIDLNCPLWPDYVDRNLR